MCLGSGLDCELGAGALGGVGDSQAGETVIFIGDCHGKTSQLLKLIDRLPPTEEVYQLGDMGIGFHGVYLPKQKHLFKWIRGNHDAPEQCRAHPNYLGDYGYIPEKKLFYLAGAWSIDAAWRKPGISWWHDEELSQPELDAATALFTESKPEIVISHECPSSIAGELLRGLALSEPGNYFGAKLECKHSRTAKALERMFEAHQPKHWIFGHYHIDKDFIVNGTHFRCCAELTAYQLPEKGGKLML